MPGGRIHPTHVYVLRLRSRKLRSTRSHRASGARMVEFGGWDMPVEYSGITDEHLAVRTRAGLFDVSHMGEIEMAGADALATVQWLTSNDASRLAIGQVQYSALTTPGGHVRRRHPGVPDGATTTSCWSSTPATS